MFLNRLNLEEKEAFIQLAHHVARSDNNFSEKEKIVITEYCIEMQIKSVDYHESEFNLVKILDTFKDPEHKKLVLLEIMALVYSDEILHSAEKAILEKIAKHFNLNPSLFTVYKEWAKAALANYALGRALIGI